MRYPLSTGEVARILNVVEPRLADLVRRGKIHPAPHVVAGRRAWNEVHIRRAAEALGITGIEHRLAEEVI